MTNNKQMKRVFLAYQSIERDVKLAVWDFKTNRVDENVQQ